MKVASLFTGLGGLDLGYDPPPSRFLPSLLTRPLEFWNTSHPRPSSTRSLASIDAEKCADLPPISPATHFAVWNKPATRSFCRWRATTDARPCCARTFPARVWTGISTRCGSFPPKRRCSPRPCLGLRRRTTTRRRARQSSNLGSPRRAPPPPKSTRTSSACSPPGRSPGSSSSSPCPCCVGRPPRCPVRALSASFFPAGRAIAFFASPVGRAKAVTRARDRRVGVFCDDRAHRFARDGTRLTSPSHRLPSPFSFYLQLGLPQSPTWSKNWRRYTTAGRTAS